MNELPNQWLGKAEDDISFATLGLEHHYYSQVCFLAQQASEKSLKGLLISKTAKHPHLHNLRELVARCAEHVPEIRPLEEIARILDQYYIPSRYPDGIPGGLSIPVCLQKNTHEKHWMELAKSVHFVRRGFAK
ncbi:MAG: HEPN domain-containing protein [Kiritimatiellae bacterium]|nr:HEPN domain-containing protein [Kiritimatiellia bacterium]